MSGSAKGSEGEKYFRHFLCPNGPVVHQQIDKNFNFRK